MDFGMKIGRIAKVSEHVGPNDTKFLRIRMAVDVLIRGIKEVQFGTAFTYNTNIYEYLTVGRTIAVIGRHSVDPMAAKDGRPEWQMSNAEITLLPESDLAFRIAVAMMLGCDEPEKATADELLGWLSEDLQVPIPARRTASTETDRSKERNAARAAERALRTEAAAVVPIIAPPVVVPPIIAPPVIAPPVAAGPTPRGSRKRTAAAAATPPVADPLPAVTGRKPRRPQGATTAPELVGAGVGVDPNFKDDDDVPF